jgi:hypothetical protein
MALKVLPLFLHDFNDAKLVRLHALYEFPSMRTVDQWISWYNGNGTILPKRAIGNKHSIQEVNGEDLVNITLFWLVRSKAYIDKVCAYVHNRNPANPPYSQSQIVRAEQRLGLSRKVASLTSNMAHSELNMHRHHLYCHAAFPDGIPGESTHHIIDLNERKFKIDDQNRKFGKVVRDKQCNTAGKYINGSQGVNLLMAIAGNERMDQTFLFHRCYTEGTTDLWWFYNYIYELCNWLAEHPPGRLFLFTMDNLNLHWSLIVQNLINSFGYRIVYSALYWSYDRAI